MKNLSSRKGIHFEALEPRILFDASAGSAPTAEVTVSTGELTANADQFINDNIEFNLTFDNNGGQEGYVPYLDFLGLPEMVIENVTAFGGSLANPGGDGVEPIGVVAADGQLVDINSGTPVDHPMYGSTIGSPSSDFFGGAGSGTEPVTYDTAFEGFYVYSVQLPFGSFTPGNPPADITVEASLNDADGILANTDYTLHARGGFALGCDPLDNPGTVVTPDDEPVFGAFDSSSVYPIVLDLVKSASVAENEGAFTGENVSGPNFPLTYRLEVDIATGETVSNLNITDVLPDDLAYLGNLTITDGSGGVIPFVINSQPAVAVDDISGVTSASNTIDITIPSVTGVSGTDVIVTYEAFIPYIEQGGDLVVDDSTGEEGDLDEYNDARVTGDWTPDGGLSQVVSDNAGPAAGGDPDGALGDRETDYIIEEHSIAIQKGVGFAPESSSGANDGGDRAASGWSEGDVAEFTMNFQISDYFAFDNVTVSDVMADGLEFLPALDPGSTWVNAGDFDADAIELRPVLTFAMHSGAAANITVAFDESNFSAVENPDGTTSIQFDVYQQLVDSNYINPGDPLLGGLIPVGGTDPADMGDDNSGVGTVGSITYRAKVRNEYVNAIGDPDVNQGDTLSNAVTISGRNLDVETLLPNGNTVTDGSSTEIEIVTGTVQKELFSTSRNGVQRFPGDLDGGLEVVPGDVITWRITYDLPLSEFEGLRLEDYLPLPVFDVADLDLTQIYAYEAPIPSDDGYLTGGRISYGPNDTFFGQNGPGATGDGGINDDPNYATPATPTLSRNLPNNAFFIDFGDYDIPESEDPVNTTIEIFVSTVITEAVYADGLLFTNQVATSESNSFSATVASNEIGQIVLGVPDLTITKGVLAVDSTSNVTFTGTSGPLGVNFNTPGSAEAFDTTNGDPIISDSLDDDPDTMAVGDEAPIDANIENADAGDVVTFGITVQNRGNADYGAFDVRISDSLPAGFEVPTTLADLNLRVTDGTGATIDYDVLDSFDNVIGSSLGGTLTPAGGSSESDVINAFFAGSIELVDPDDNTGALTEYDGTSGENLVLIAYDLVVEDTAVLNSTLTNTATVENFSYRNGGPNYAEPEDMDTASVSIVRPAVVKTLVNTSHDAAANLDAQGEVAIGEVVTYSVTIDIPEGTLPNAVIRDMIQPGMEFVGVDSISFDAGLTTSKGTGDFSDVDVYYNPSASTIELGVGGSAGLGAIVNTNTDNSVAEQVTITYRALVLNDAVNQAGVVRSNDASIQWQQGGNTQVENDTADVTVVEPNITVTKSVSGGDTQVEGAEMVTYRIVVRNVDDGSGNVSEGYEVELSDLLPDDVTFVSATHFSGLAPTGAVTHTPGSGSNGEITASWDVFAVGAVSRIDVTVTVNNGLPTDTVIQNTAEVDFTSLPGDPGDVNFEGFDPTRDAGDPTFSPGTAPVAVERTGDPTDPGGAVNDYNDDNSANITVINPVGIDKVVIETSETHTGEESSAAGDVHATIGEVVRYEVRIRLPQANSTNLELVDTLGAGLQWIDAADNDIQFRLEGFNPDGSTISADPDIEAAILTPQSLNASRVSFNSAANTVTFDFGNIINTETDLDDGMAPDDEEEFIYISYNAIVENSPGVDRGDVVENTVQLREGGANIGSPLSQEITVVEPDVTIGKSDNGVTTADAGDIIDYTLTITAGSSSPQDHSTAFDLLISDALPAELDLVANSVAVIGLPAASTEIISENTTTDSFTVAVDLLEPGETFQITFQAEVRDSGANIIRADETVTNNASLTYSTLPLDGTDESTVGTPTDNTTGSEAGTPGDSDGERITTRSNSDSFSSPDPILFKELANTADTTFTIGEAVEYVITLTVPEGQTGGTVASIVDTIDPGFSFVPGTLTVTTGAGVTVGTAGALNEGNTDFFTFTDPGNTASAEELRFDFEEVTFNDANAADGLNTGTIEIRYQLQVENIIANQQGNTLNNTADFLYTDGDSANTITLQDTDDLDTIIMIVEPQVDAAKTITTLPDPAQAGETVVYEVTLTNPGGPANLQQNVTAFEVTAQDTIPTGLTFDQSSFSAFQGGNNITGSFALTATGWTLPAGANIDLDPGEVITVTYSATIDVENRDGEVLTNTVDVDWTSLDSDDATDGIDVADTGERGGFGDLDTDNPGGDPNNYEDTATADMPVNFTPVFDLEKTIINTSLAETGTAGGTSAAITDLVIGETVTYQLVATLPRGTVDNVRIIDQLSLGNGLLDITNVQISAGAALTLPGGAALTTISPTVTDSATADTYDDRVVFNFGTVINTPPMVPVAGDDQIVITITALLVNDIENQQGDVITNTGQLRFLDDLNGDGTRTEQVIESTVDVEIVEPQINTNKRVTTLPTTLEAGVTVPYEVTLTHPGGAGNLNQLANAYDVNARDTLPADMVLQTGTFTALFDNGTTVTDIEASFFRNANGWSVLPGADIDMEPGDVITITYDAVIAVTVNDQDLLTNEVDVEWTSLDGANPGDTDPNERGGDGDLTTESDPVNDYESGDEVTIQTDFDPTITKTVFSTTVGGDLSSAGDNPLLEDLVIGEEVTYEILVTLGRGTTEDVRIFDQLDIAEGLLDITSVQATFGSALSPEGGGSLNSTAVITDSLGGSDGIRDTFDLVLGNVVNNASGAETSAEQVRLLVTATVLNVLENQQGDEIENTATLFYRADPDADGTRTIESISDTASVEIIEPQVDTVKTTTSIPATPESGEVIGYQVTLTNPGGAANEQQNVTAFDVTAQDVLPTNLDLVTGMFAATSSVSGDVTGSFIVTVNGWSLPASEGLDLVAGEVITITYEAVIQEEVFDGEALTNEVDAEWTSIDGTALGNGVNGERTGDGDLNDDPSPGSVNNYESDDEVTVYADFPNEITKTVLNTSSTATDDGAGTSTTIEDLVVGETVTYEIVATLGRGTNQNIQIIDQLSTANGLLDITSIQIFPGADLALASGDINVVGSFLSDSLTSGDVAGSDGYRDRFVSSFGTVINSATGARTADETIRFVVTATLVNDAENQQGDVIENTATLEYRDDPNQDGNFTIESISASVNVEIIEPQVDTNKRVTTLPGTLEAGVTVPYEVTLTNSSDVTAFDLSARDSLPADLVLQTGSFTAILDPGGANTDLSGFFTVSATGWEIQAGGNIDLAPGQVIEINYNTIIAVTVNDQDLLTNEVDAEWTSLDGADANERGGDGDLDTEGDPLNNYESGDEVTIRTDFEPVILKRVLSTSSGGASTDGGDDPAIEDLVIGEQVTYEVLVTLGRGTTEDVRIFDQLEISEGLLNITTVDVSYGSSLTLQGGGALNTNAVVSDALGAGDGIFDTFDLVVGNVVNSGSGSVDPDEQIRLLVTGTVVNDIANQQGDEIENTATLFYTADPNADGVRTTESIDDSATIEIVEPVVNTAKTITTLPANPTAGERVEYQVVLSNPAPGGGENVIAYDVTARDDLPTNLSLDTASFEARINGSLISDALFTLTGDGWSIVTPSGIDLNQGDSLVITYEAVIQPGVQDGENLINEVDAEWTSLDGTVAGERTGDGNLDTETPIGQPNNYESGDTANFDAEFTSTFAFDKAIVTSSQGNGATGAGTSNLITDLVVGETVTYSLTATLGRGTTDGVRIIDQLSIAEGLLDITNVTINPGAALRLDSGNPFSSITPVVTDALGGDTYRDRIEIDFGTVVNDPAFSTGAADEQIQILVTALVVNVADNTAGDVIGNTADFFYFDDPDGNGIQTEESIRDTEVVEILEPNLSITKSVDNDQPRLNEVLTYTLTVSNNAGVSTTDAFDLVIDDLMDPRMTLDISSVQLVVQGAPANPSSIVSNTSTASNLVLGIDRLDDGEVIQITYEVRVSSDIADYNAVLPNDVDLNYTSIAGPNPEERGGDPLTNDPNDPDTYSDSDDESVEVFQPDLRIEKVDFDAVITPGSLITYQMTVTNQGRVEAFGVNVTDDISHYLDGGFVFVSGTNATLTGGVVTFDLPDMPVNDVQVITMVLRAPDAIPAGLESITNIAVANHDDIDPTPLDNEDPEETPVIAVPDLVVTKDDGLLLALTGDEITYVIEFTNVGDQIASGVIIEDILPPGMEFVSASNGGILRGNSVFWGFGELAPGEVRTVEVTALVREPGLKINTVTVKDDGSGGPDPTPDNNRDTDETLTERRFVYDLTQDFRTANGNQTLHEHRWGSDRVLRREPVILATYMASGLAQAGSTITLEVYDERGQLIADTSVVTDAGGNWLASFPMADVEKQPARIEMKQTWASYNPAGERSYNFRTYFGPAFSTGTYYTEQLTVLSVMEKRNPAEVIDLYESSKMILAMDWNGQLYEFAARGALQSSSGN